MSNLINIIIDPNQIFKSTVDLNNLPEDLCLSKNKYLYDFLKLNPNLINYYYLICNESDWAVELLLEDINIIDKIKKIECGIEIINRNNNRKITKFLKDNDLIILDEVRLKNNDIAAEITLNEYKNKELSNQSKHELMYDLFNHNDNNKIVDFIISQNMSANYISNIYDSIFYSNYNNKLLEYIKEKNITVYEDIIKYMNTNKNKYYMYYNLFNKYK